MDDKKVIKEALKEKKVLLGKNSTVKALKKGGLKSVFLANNCPKDILKEMEYYSKISKTELEEFGDSSPKLGQLCGKPFSITVIGIKK